MSQYGKVTATLPGQTGNNTHPSVELPPDFEQSILNFVVEAIGATPTVTYKWQVSFDGPEVSDANSLWFDAQYTVPLDTAETFVATTRVRTTVSSDPLSPYLGAKVKSVPRKIRLVTTANTNVTYRGEALGRDQD